MPKREDEFWAAQKEDRGKPLCPFCGSLKVYYNAHFKSWRCGACEKSFPAPSWGVGLIAEEENHHLVEDAIEDNGSYNVENTVGVDLSKSRAWFRNEYYDSKSRRWKKPGRKGSSILKSFVIIIAVIFIILIVIFLLYVFGFL